MRIKNESVRKIIERIISEESFYWYIVITLLIVPFAEFISERNNISFYTQPILIEMSGIVGALMSAAHLLMRKEKKYYPTDLFYGLLIILAYLSMIFANWLLS